MQESIFDGFQNTQEESHWHKKEDLSQGVFLQNNAKNHGNKNLTRFKVFATMITFKYHDVIVLKEKQREKS